MKTKDGRRILDILKSESVCSALLALRTVEGYDREKRLLAVAFARRVQHKMTDRGVAVLDVAEGFANGDATKEELEAAKDGVWGTARDVADSEAWVVAMDASSLAGLCNAIRDADRAALWEALRAIGVPVEGDAGWGALLAAQEAASAAERAWQAEELRRVCLAIEAGQEPYQKKEVAK